MVKNHRRQSVCIFDRLNLFHHDKIFYNPTQSTLQELIVLDCKKSCRDEKDLIDLKNKPIDDDDFLPVEYAVRKDNSPESGDFIPAMWRKLFSKQEQYTMSSESTQ